MQKRVLLSAVSVLILVQLCLAESSAPTAEQAESNAGTITGKVFDTADQSVSGALVILCDQNSGVPVCKETFRPFTEAVSAEKGDPLKDIVYVVTNDQGCFSFEKVPVGEYRLVAQSWKDAEEFKGIFEINGKEIQLHGIAEHIRVCSEISPDIVLRPLGTGVLQVDEDMPNDETLLVISTSPTRADPILGFAGWDGAFMQNMIGGNRMPEGKTTIYGLPEGKVYLAMFAADSVPGWTEGQAEITPNTTTVMENIPFVNSWSDSRHHPSEKLKPLVEELKSTELPQEHPLTDFYRKLQWEMGAGTGPWHYTQVVIKYLDKEFELPSGRKATFGDIAAARRYIDLQRFVKEREEKRKKRAELIKEFSARYETRKRQGAYCEPIDYSSASTFFPDDPEAGRELEVLLVNKDSIFYPPPYGEWLEIIRRGFRRASIDKQGLLSTISWKYIHRQSPPNQRALDIVYYASYDPQCMYSAVYSGLSVVNPKSEKVLKRLVDIAMEYKQLGRIIWGVKETKQEREFIALLETHLNSANNEMRKRAEIVKKVLEGKIDGRKLSREWELKRREQKLQQREQELKEDAAKVREEFARQLPEIKQTLLNDDSKSRLAELRRIEEHRLYLVLDESFFPAFQKCAEDKDSKVRRTTAIVLGRHWIWGARLQSAEAIKIMLQLSKDDDPEVKHKAVYYGLSVVRDKNDEILKRLVDIAMHTKNYDTYERICWGLRGDRDIVQKALLEYLDRKEYDRQLLTNFYQHIFKEDLPETSTAK